MTSHQPGADERRVQAALRRLGVGADAETRPLPPMPSTLPDGFGARPRDWLDDLLDSNSDEPTPRPAPTPTPPAPEPAPAPAPAPEEPPEHRDWTWLARWIRPWHTVTAGAVSVLPLFNGWSPATGWALVLHDMRADSVGGAYTTAAVTLALAYALDLRRRRWLLRLALITTAVGSLGVLDLFDPVTLVTGVHR
ncbi:hypothetical protein [Streptomyces sp. NPDC088785]|uniref:hypothetical protein n=1 Tax=Streptomyces sp. NPDC088785 TaxID=3365897 RepID=UPI0037F38750